MLLKSPIIAILLVGIANALRNCDDCTELTQCTEAFNRVKAGNSKATYNILKKANCGYHKVCCSDFSVSVSAVEDKNELNSDLNNVYEIENHPNVKLLPGECGKIEGERVIGGRRAKINEFPWIALISYKIGNIKVFGCAGTVINERYVLTAAHCIKKKDIVGVRIGEYNISSRIDCIGSRTLGTCQSLQDIRVSKKIIHPNYTGFPSYLNDIGLLRVKKPINLALANAGAICLPVLRSLHDIDLAGEWGVVAGWGITEKTKSDVLLKVELPIHDKNTCMSFYDRIGNLKSSDRFSGAFCAGELHRDFCDGDSGGPFMLEALHNNEIYKMTQYGIVSYGPILCGSEIPGVYTDVKTYLKWILDNIQP